MSKKKKKPVTAAPRKALPPIPGTAAAAVGRHSVPEADPGPVDGTPGDGAAHEPPAAADHDGEDTTAARVHAPGGRQLAGAGYTPAGAKRRDRKAAVKAAERIRAAADTAEKTAAKEALAAER